MAAIFFVILKHTDDGTGGYVRGPQHRDAGADQIVRRAKSVLPGGACALDVETTDDSAKSPIRSVAGDLKTADGVADDLLGCEIGWRHAEISIRHVVDGSGENRLIRLDQVRGTETVLDFLRPFFRPGELRRPLLVDLARPGLHSKAKLPAQICASESFDRHNHEMRVMRKTGVNATATLKGDIFTTQEPQTGIK